MLHDTPRQPDLRSGKEDMRVGEGSRDDIQEAGRAGALVRGGAAVMSGEWTGWERRESGPDDAVQTALLLPGGMCTAVQYEELMAEPALAGVRMIAVTVPGMGGTLAPKDLSIENLARLAAQCAADGHGAGRGELWPGLFPVGEGLWRIREFDHDGGLVPSSR